ncbi:MAG TPA: hypothetical protein VGP96_12690 [Candidatus Dormibacteraeota bacterium]|nr:hypothetical protein [Candidatus Dormibacteraeota bacterium]
MQARPPAAEASSNQALRAALLAADDTARVPAQATAAAATPGPAPASTMLPTAPELLESSPNLQRLCESYHRTYRHMLARNRRQRLGLAVLVAAVGVAAVMLAQSHAFTVTVASSLVVAVGVASAAGVALLALLWVRDDRRLRRVQGERLMRALQFNCSLHEDRLNAFRRLSHPTAAFFDCYALWRERHPDSASGLAAVVRSLRGLGSATG